MALIEENLLDIDLVLVMSVHPGFGGQKFIPEVVGKIKKLREIKDKENLKFDIEVDGGINFENSKTVIDAGANILVSGTTIFKSNNGDIKLNEIKVIDLINYYNFKYEIQNFSEVEAFDLSFSTLRNYFQKNILAFGDIIHKVHPLAGQGFNISLRDLQVLSKLIQKKIDLGLPLDISIFQEFENNTKHLNYVFISGIDLIYEFFKFDNKIKNNISNIFFKIIDKNKNLNKFFSSYANKGLVL